MTPDALLASLPSLTLAERDRTLSAHARALSATELDAQLAALWERDEVVALFLATAGHRVWLVERALTSEVPAVRLRAHLSDLLPSVPLDSVVAAVRSAPKAARAATYRRIRARRWQDLAEALFEPVLDRWGPAEAAALLVSGGSAFVGAHLAEVAHAVTNWAVLGERHPGVMLAEAERALSSLPEHQYEAWWRHHSPGVEAAAEREPARALDVVERYGPKTSLPSWLTAKPYAMRADAERTLRLVVTAAQRDRTVPALSKSALHAAVREGGPWFVEFGRVARERPHLFVRLLRAVPPARRPEFFDAAHAGSETSRAYFPYAVLTKLPRGRRAEEARRMLAIHRERGQETPSYLLPLLPLTEASEELRELTRRGKPEDRANGYQLLIACAAADRDPEALAEVLGWVAERTAREQEPVRVAILSTLDRVHPRSITPGALDGLDRFVSALLDARDTSLSSVLSLVSVLFGVLGHDGDPAVTAYATKTLRRAWEHTACPLPYAHRILRHGQEHDLVDALLPVATAAARRQDFGPLGQLVASLGRRAEHVPALVPLLESQFRDGTEYDMRSAAAELLKPKRTRRERLTRLLELDPSAIALEPVRRIILHAQVDRLDLLLVAPWPSGRAHGPEQKARELPVTDLQAHRWSPRHRRIHADLLTNLIEDPEQQRWARAAALRALGDLGQGAETLRRYLDDTDELLAQAAMAGWVRQADPAAILPELLARAKVSVTGGEAGQSALSALYSARRCAARVAPDRLGEILLGTLAAAKTPTAKKELLRMVAHFAIPRAMDVVAEYFRAPKQHRDVKGACVTAAVTGLDSPVAWEILREAVPQDREVRAPILRVGPFDMAEPRRAEFAGLLVGLASDGPENQREYAVGALRNWLAWAPERVSAIAGFVTDLDERLLWRAALGALVPLCAWTPGREALAGIARDLVGTTEPADAEATRDLPARQRLRRLVEELSLAAGRLQAREAALEVADAVTGTDAMKLRISVARMASTAEDLLADLDPMRDARPVQLVHAAAALASRAATAEPWEPSAVLEAARTTEIGSFAVALAGAGSRLGWPEPWRLLVRALRRHADPDVRDRAFELSTAPE
ncbi:hypothetical protein [Amycolatopsis sp. CA-230715]|uniref:hypothetical protein n=1 Tax=Amycolatopsis sp. CA-230715 TaxID=2745196 RepID=UPI001C014853|nr:hypothetical protein [Amycolatopsis sp. CA-230715]QWF80507.1 hypothetical protein HUW46_03930 [Amycolatopsis sp. CA-230715]